MKPFQIVSRLLAVILTPVVAGSAAGAGSLFYVGPAGNDSNPGSLSQPFLTLQRGVNAAGPGDTIIVRDGTYRGGCISTESYAVTINKAGAPSAWITLKSENKWGATLDAANVCHSYINLGGNAAYWVIQDFRVINGYSGGIWSNAGADYITVRGNEIAYIGRRYLTSTTGLCGSYANASSHHLTFEGNVIHDIGRTGGVQTFHDHGLYLHSQDTNVVNNVFIEPIEGWSIQTASGFSGLIANNTFHGPHSSREGQLMLWDANGSVTIRNNIFYEPRRQAITQYQFRPASCTVDYNIVYGAGDSLGAPLACSSNNNLLNTDPMLASGASTPYDFHLRAGSPAIDSGMALAEVTTDIDDVPRPQGSGPDIGAFEYFKDRASLKRPYFETPWVVNSASFTEGLSPGSFGTIFGLHLSSGGTGVAGPPFPTVLADTRVLLAGSPVGLQYASQKQINFRVPADLLPDTISLVVSTPDGDSPPARITVQAAAPAIFVFPDSNNAGVIMSNGAGMEIYCTGLGAVNSTTGQTVLPVTVRMGGQELTPSFSGSDPTYPGLYVVKADVPTGLTGAQTVSLQVNGIRSNEVIFRAQ